MTTPLLKVLHIVPIWLPQTQTWLYNQITCLPPDIESHIACELTENLDQFSIANLHHLYTLRPLQQFPDRVIRRLGFRSYLRFVADIAKRHNVQILHSHFGNVGWENLAIARRQNLRQIVTFYGQDVNRLPKTEPHWYNRYQKMFNEIDGVLCEGPFMREKVITLGCPPDKIYVHHLGVRVDQIAFQPRVWHQDEPLRILIAAAFREKKGIPYALEALAHLRDESNLTTLEITIIGDANAEPRSQHEKQKIVALLDKLNLRPIVRLLGYQPHTVFLEELHSHHIFLSPSVTASDGDTEGGAPVSLIEAQAAGTLIVSSQHCDIPEVVQEGRTGLLAPERDVIALATQLKWLIEHPYEWRRLVEAGRQHVSTHFDAVIQANQLKTRYQKIAQ